MDTINGYKVAYEKKKKILYSRMDDSMIQRLREIRKKTGISVSEVIREAVRRLLQEVDEKKFRLDLYHRLSVIIIHVPSLNERKDDIPLLSEKFLADILFPEICPNFCLLI